MQTETQSVVLPDRETHELTSLPILLLNVHDNCNCRCIMCDIWKREPGAGLDLANFVRHRESIRTLNVQHVVLTGGEPLLHQGFDELCDFLRICGVRITLLTTGLLLAKRAESVADKVDEVIISLDGPREIHDGIRRVVRAFDLIQSGVAAVQRHRVDMPIHARSTVQRANFLHLRQTVEAAKHLRLDSISFLAADVSSTAFNRELIWPGERQNQIALTRDEVDGLEREIELLIEECDEDIVSGYIAESPAKLRRIARRFREHFGDVPAQSPRCNAPWVSAVMEVDGSIRPCFFHRRIGDASSTSLESAINSQAALDFRRKLDIENDPVCRRCVCSLHYKM